MVCWFRSNLQAALVSIPLASIRTGQHCSKVMHGGR